MKKIWSIAKWEFLERIRNRLFIITLIVAPLLVVAVGAAAGMLTESNLSHTKVIGLKTNNVQYFHLLSAELEKIDTKTNQPAFITISVDANQELSRDMVDGILNIKDINGKSEAKLVYTFSLSPLEISKIENAVTNSLLQTKLMELGSSHKFHRINFSTEPLRDNAPKEVDFNSFFFTSFAFLFLFIVVIIFSGSNFVRALIEEKTTHINEILLSSSTPKQILFGKYIGLLFIGLLQTLFWFFVSYIFFSQDSLQLNLSPNYLLLILYFILGYLLYTSLFLAFGAQISSESESQQVTTLVSLFLLLPIVLSTQIIISPESFLSTLLTYIPFTTSPLMLIKINIVEVGVIEILSTIALQLISIFIVLTIASKYFANGLRQFEKKKRK